MCCIFHQLSHILPQKAHVLKKILCYKLASLICTVHCRSQSTSKHRFADRKSQKQKASVRTDSNLDKFQPFFQKTVETCCKMFVIHTVTRKNGTFFILVDWESCIILQHYRSFSSVKNSALKTSSNSATHKCRKNMSNTLRHFLLFITGTPVQIIVPVH